MSGSTGSSDIEDVVASVRRLVSVDGRTRPLSRDLNGDKLLLTPALQVVAEDAPAPPLVLSGALSVAPPARTDDPASAVPLAVVLADDALDSPADEPSVPAPETLVTPTEALVDSVAEAATAEVEPAPALVEPHIDSPSAELVATTAVPDVPVDNAAISQEPVAQVAEHPVEPPERAPAIPPLQLVEDEWEDEIWTEPEPPLAELALGVEEAELLPDQPLPPEPAPEPTSVEDSRAAGPDRDSPWAQFEGDWQGDLPDPVVSFGSHRARMTAAAPSPRGMPITDAVELTDTDGNPLTILDEAALQDIIRQLIREELQGGLGERITRNVRKLVRAEINRALAARALD